jgi:hypothetical protein
MLNAFNIIIRKELSAMTKGYYSPETLQDAWGFTKAPYFGDLYKYPEKYEELFKFRKQFVSDIIWRLKSEIDSKIVVMSGAPGVGKSTILDYLKRYKFSDTMERVSLAERLDGINDYGFTEVTTEHFLHIFGEIEKFLNKIMLDHGIIPPTGISPKIKDYIEFRHNAIPFEEFARDIILPKCKLIGDMGSKIPRYILAIDDVDYLFPFSQKAIMSVLCSMSCITLNPLIIYAARPLAATIANTHLNSYAHHLTGPVIEVEPLDAYAVIETRLRSVSNAESYNNPFSN